MQASEVKDKVVIPTPFAQNGDRRTFGQESNSSESNYPMGIPSIYSLDLALGGKHAERQDVNGIGYIATQPYYWMQNGQLIMWSQDVVNAISGYPCGARLWYETSSHKLKLIESGVDDNTIEPGNNTIDIPTDNEGNASSSGTIKWYTITYG